MPKTSIKSKVKPCKVHYFRTESTNSHIFVSLLISTRYDKSFLSTEKAFRGGEKDSHEPANYSLVSANQRILKRKLREKIMADDRSV